jgi:hypothetical protein
VAQGFPIPDAPWKVLHPSARPHPLPRFRRERRTIERARLAAASIVRIRSHLSVRGSHCGNRETGVKVLKLIKMIKMIKVMNMMMVMNLAKVANIAGAGRGSIVTEGSSTRF